MSIRAKLKGIRNSHSYRVERAKLEFVRCISKLMNSRGESNADLARSLESSPAYVSKVMRGETNLTIDSMIKITHALGAQLHIHVAPANHRVRWFDAIEQAPQQRAQAPCIDIHDLQPVSPQSIFKESASYEDRRLCA